jgi:hypothetical protein
MSQRIVCQWSERFKNGRTSVKHREGTGRQFTSITDAETAHTVATLKKLIFLSALYKGKKNPIISLDRP